MRFFEKILRFRIDKRHYTRARVKEIFNPDVAEACIQASVAGNNGRLEIFRNVVVTNVALENTVVGI